MENIREGKELLIKLEEEKTTLLNRLIETDKQIVDLKIKLAIAELNEKKEETAEKVEEPKEEVKQPVPTDLVAMVRIEFRPGGKTYDYLWPHKEYPGEYVYIESYDKGAEKVKVVKAFRTKKQPNRNYKTAWNNEDLRIPFN